MIIEIVKISSGVAIEKIDYIIYPNQIHTWQVQFQGLWIHATCEWSFDSQTNILFQKFCSLKKSVKCLENDYFSEAFHFHNITLPGWTEGLVLIDGIAAEFFKLKKWSMM